MPCSKMQRTSGKHKGRVHRSSPGQHSHCEKCFNRYCQVSLQPAVSCVMINCRSHCGATFHLCKEEEHQLLCPLEWVPCLNSVFGCPFSMSRVKLAKHLKVCPASVVCCSMEWNRWPNIDSKTPLYENIMKEQHSEECLDIFLALRDQKILFSSLNMAHLFPELSEHIENIMPTSEMQDIEGAVGGSTTYDSGENITLGADGFDIAQLNETEETELSQFECEVLAKDKESLDLVKYKAWEHIFSKEHSTSKDVADVSNLGQKVQNKSKKDEQEVEASPVEEQNKTQPQEYLEKKGLAPWQEGVLERLKKEVDIRDYNMYLVHHGKMLIHFGQMAACTPREKDFVYGNLEAQEVKTVYTFKIPSSYRKKRGVTGDGLPKPKKEDKSIDTSDLRILLEDLPKSDDIKTTLLCAMERELKGHEISEKKAIDGLFVDIGTQIYSFDLERFPSHTVLADILPDRNPGLHLDLQDESVTQRHNKSSSAFSFICNHFFRRDEFPSHFKNVHSDIQSCLDGWFQQRCPLSYLGCTFVQRRFRPPDENSKIIYSQQLDTFAVKPQLAPMLYQGVKSNLSRNQQGKNKDSLTSLPLEILQHIAGFLDSFSLSQLSQVSTLMRDVCGTLLHERGMVFLKWEKKRYSHGGTSWKARKKVWQFSSLFSTVSTWHFDDIPSMSEHLKTCPYYAVECRQDPVPLTSMCEPCKQEKESLLTFKHRLSGKNV
ncbi:F-box only protein 40 [Microcaecilia unicolor]|uniref:F-box only protein 40 n=1 Tax=Microcaecilia unicolor TaxID=1415580 RepID=A0A6P7Y4M4_9AMPH|nr:F-box only protein 40 [Microcaecilia unicolor]XP_030059843.1 F-box only protein 40 [Microcaecilia unicolor]